MRFIFAFLVIAMLQSLSVSAEDPLPTTTVTVLPDLKIKAELALDDATRAKGLMFRKTLAENAGMLFVFPVLDFQNFWMKNTLIPLDMIWLNEHKEVIYFVTADPCKSDPCRILRAGSKINVCSGSQWRICKEASSETGPATSI